MLDYLLGIILLGLGLQSPVTSPMVKGDQTENVQEATETAEIENENEAHATGSANALLKNKHEAFRQKLRSEQEKFRLEFEEHKASAEARLQTKKEAFELKLAEFKDKAKKAKVENIQQRLEEHNTKLTQRATENLAKMSELLDRVIEKVQIEKNNGKDTAAVDAAIVAAQSAITVAQDAIANQAGKTYVTSVSSEDTVKVDMSSVIKLLSTDAKIMHEAIVAARKAVSTVISELAKVRGEPVPEAVIK